MRWTNIIKHRSNCPEGLNYSECKPYLRLESNSKCVYCAMHENQVGGFDYFHVEHFRPKSNPRFRDLTHNYYNLYYSCPICNRFKGASWPNDPVVGNSIPSFIDPSKNDYNHIFNVDDNGLLSGKTVAAKYMIEKINLNRPQLIIARKIDSLNKKMEEVIDKVFVQLSRCLISKDDEVIEYGKQLLESFHSLLDSKKLYSSLSPYEKNEISRQ
ncbi:MAG: HNH endonuclease [Bacteroidota bacterium]